MTSLRNLLLRFARCTSGAALVEMTLVMPLAISLMAGGVEFGLALNAQATGSKAVRDAARYLASVPAGAVCGWGLTNAKSLAVYGKFGGVDGVDTPLVAGWRMSGGVNNQVVLAQPANCAVAFNVIQLEAKFPYSSFMLGAVLPNVAVLTLSANHEERHIGQ
jgi:TadE-like protein